MPNSGDVPKRKTPQRDIQWADGLRGIACLLVVFAHSFQAFFWPSHAFDRRPYLFQLPFGRLVLEGGYLSVGVFFLMSGYVCAIKPLRLSGLGRADEARKVIASSVFRRLFRLGMPATAATTISWFLCQVGAFNLARSLPPGWLAHQSSPPSAGFLASLTDLCRACLHTWSYDGPLWYSRRNYYETIQWTMIYELRGSMSVYLALGTTSAFTPAARRSVFIILTTYSLFYGDFLGDVPFYTGVLLADLSLHLKSKTIPQPLSSLESGSYGLISIFKGYWAIAMAIFALFLGSYPPDSPERAPWSQFLHRIAYNINPATGNYVWHFTLFGALLLVFSIHFSVSLRAILAHRYAVFLGSISFPLYLLHSLLMRSVLVWVVFGLLPTSPDGWIPINTDPERIFPIISAIITVVAFGSWLALLMYLSAMWRDRIDRLSVTFAQWAEDAMLDQKSFWTAFHRILAFLVADHKPMLGDENKEVPSLEKLV